MGKQEWVEQCSEILVRCGALEKDIATEVATMSYEIDDGALTPTEAAMTELGYYVSE